jgi:FLVCR family feline leukemia virus subgroup C receptor-related protein
LICLGFTFLTIEIVFFDSLSFILLTITHFFIGAGFGGIYSILLESLMEKHYPVQELAIGSLVDAVASVIFL